MENRDSDPGVIIIGLLGPDRSVVLAEPDPILMVGSCSWESNPEIVIEFFLEIGSLCGYKNISIFYDLKNAHLPP